MDTDIILPLDITVHYTMAQSATDKLTLLISVRRLYIRRKLNC